MMMGLIDRIKKQLEKKNWVEKRLEEIEGLKGKELDSKIGSFF